MRIQGHSEARPERAHFRPRPLSIFCLLGCLLLVSCLESGARPLVSTESPIGFFTNVAARLLRAELDLDLNRIQLYPTNQYAPAVHRLLQVTANLYDATTNRTITDYPHVPSVFRPLFGRDGDIICISGYAEESGTNLLHVPAMRDLQNPADRAALQPMDMVFGVPVIIGAKKGFPNFNEFGMQTSVEIARKLEFRRQSGNPALISETNQMYIVGISNVFGVEAWNSYRSAFPRDLEIHVRADIIAVLTTDSGTVLVSNRTFSGSTSVITANTWTGFVSQVYPPFSLKVPLITNYTVFPPSTYSQALGQFVPLTGTFERLPGFPVPRWWFGLRTQLRFVLVDTSVNRIVDYVNLDASRQPAEISSMLSSGAQCDYPYVPDGSRDSLWCTNRIPPGVGDLAPTFGIRNQIEVSLYRVQSPVWPANNENIRNAIDFFRAQFSLAPMFHPGPFVLTNLFQAPFTPTRVLSFYARWQANDPLVHYTVSDLTDSISLNPTIELDSTEFSPMRSVGGTQPVNSHYRPWGSNPYWPDTTFGTDRNLSVKDPVLMDRVTNPDNRGCSGNWDFPTNLTLNANWLGRVHRGTPWQTIYLKSPSVPLETWMAWTGDKQLVTNWNRGGMVTFDAASTLPTNDWRLASFLVSLLSTNDPGEMVSVNQPGVPAWSAALDGMTVLTNTGATLVMSSNSPQTATIAAALDTARSSQPGRYFRGPGEILAVPELSTGSPWLDISQSNSISDAAYEAIPSQLLPRLRLDSIGSVVQSGGTVQVQFTGSDAYRYAVEVSTNLLDWTTVSTNAPSHGAFNFSESLSGTTPRRFYRSVLLP